MHRTFTVKSLQLKLRSVCAIHHQFTKQSLPTPWSDPSKAGCILYFVYKTYALKGQKPGFYVNICRRDARIFSETGFFG